MEYRTSAFASVDRSLITLKPTQAFLDWCNEVERRIDPVNPKLLEYESVCILKNAYLTPELETQEEFDKWMKKNFKAIFEEEVAGWYIDPELWPKKMDLRTFRKFFQIEFIDMVLDSG
ncbi:MAG: hypothetical protein GY786_21075 [Proteobacteria bacterium]|nr:hypothetical protein [Pseudomonadota bacterium]